MCLPDDVDAVTGGGRPDEGALRPPEVVSLKLELWNSRSS